MLCTCRFPEMAGIGDWKVPSRLLVRGCGFPLWEMAALARPQGELPVVGSTPYQGRAYVSEYLYLCFGTRYVLASLVYLTTVLDMISFIYLPYPLLAQSVVSICNILPSYLWGVTQFCAGVSLYGWRSSPYLTDLFLAATVAQVPQRLRVSSAKGCFFIPSFESRCYPLPSIRSHRASVPKCDVDMLRGYAAVEPVC